MGRSKIAFVSTVLFPSQIYIHVTRTNI